MLYINKEGKRAMSRQILKKERIITDRLTLGSYRKEDRDRLAEMMRNPEITATFMVPDYSEEVQFYALADKLIEFSQINDTTHLEYGVYLDGYMIGFVNDCGYDDEAIELGYVIDPAFKGRGFATEAVNAVINELHEMGFKKVVAGFLKEKCGMHLNGNSDYEEYRGKKYKCYECEMEL